ncbi:MAG: PqqD family protein [Candidatus Schekmanbacteria bacterium]|nr:PqqD family protein [Candidatus Schekmanbacteria bacterium]
MATIQPLQKSGIISRKIGRENMLYNPENKSVLVLNASAALVWGMCDGRHTIPDIKRNLETACLVPEAVNLESDIGEILQELTKSGVLFC